MQKIDSKRPSWDEYFMNLAYVVCSRSDCIRRSVGALIVKDFRIISTGYNGTPHGVKNCTEGGCIRCKQREEGSLQRGENEESCICIHAEQNAIIQAAYQGISTKGAVLYCTTMPCSSCSKMIVNAGIVEVVHEESFHDDLALQLLQEVQIKVRQYKK